MSKKNPAKRTERQQAYDRFLQSSEWFKIRGEAFQKYGYKCEVCECDHCIHLHHVFYPNNWADTKVEHLIPLCKKHHDLVHQLHGTACTDEESDAAHFRYRLLRQLHQVARIAMKSKRDREIEKMQKKNQATRQRLNATTAGVHRNHWDRPPGCRVVDYKNPDGNWKEIPALGWNLVKKTEEVAA